MKKYWFNCDRLCRETLGVCVYADSETEAWEKLHKGEFIEGDVEDMDTYCEHINYGAHTEPFEISLNAPELDSVEEDK